MKIYKEILQQSDEWYRLRYGKIGGSTLKHLMTGKAVTDCAIYNELLSARMEEYEYEDNYMSPDMERGNAYEPLARMEFERLNNIVVDQYGWLELDNGIAGISPDGIIGSKFWEACEIKCPSRNTHMSYIRNPISMVEEYIWQVVQYFLVIDKLKKLYFLSYRPENKSKKLLTFEVTRKTVVRLSSKEVDSIENLVKKAKYRLKQLDSALIKDISIYLPQF